MTTPSPTHQIVEEDGEQIRLRSPEQAYAYVAGAQSAIDRLGLADDENQFARGYRNALDDVMEWMREDGKG